MGKICVVLRVTVIMNPQIFFLILSLSYCYAFLLGWMPTRGVKDVILGLESLFGDLMDFDDPLNLAAAESYNSDKVRMMLLFDDLGLGELWELNCLIEVWVSPVFYS